MAKVQSKKKVVARVAELPRRENYIILFIGIAVEAILAVALLRSGRGVWLSGPPGSGRSALLDRLAEDLAAEGRGQVPWKIRQQVVRFIPPP